MSYEAFPLRGESDRAEVQRLWRDNLGDQRIKAAIVPRWQWLAERNPAGPAKMIAVANSTGELIGSAAALPRVLRVGERQVLAAVLCDFVVDRRHRSAGAAVTLQRALARACFADGIKLLYGFPNETAFPILARVGYKTVGSAAMLFKPIRSANALRNYLPPALARAAGFLVDRVIAPYDLQLYLRHRRGRVDTVRERAGADFQALWEEGKETQPIAGERTPAHLNWRYATHPVDRCMFFCLTDRADGRLLGYVAYSAVLGKVNVLDAFWHAPEAIQPLFVRFLWRMRALGHASVSVCYAGDEALVRCLRRLAFVRSKQRRNLVCAVAECEADIGAVVGDLNRWSLFDGELDI